MGFCRVKLFFFTTLVGLSLIFSSCSNVNSFINRDKNIITESGLLIINDRNGYEEVIVLNPDSVEVAHYVLLAPNDTLPQNIPASAIVITVPAENIVLDSEIYAEALTELESQKNIKGVFDAEYLTNPYIRKQLAAGEITDLGKTDNINAEKISALNPDVILLSYFEGMKTQGVDKLGIPIVKMFDLQESTPLGRAEWLRFIGRLTGRKEQADSIFDAVAAEYKALADQTKKFEALKKPKILTEIMYEGLWSVPGGKSYQSTLIKDAGGKFFREDDNHPVSVNLSPEQILAQGGDADIWLIRYFGDKKSLTEILQSDPVYKEIKAFKTGNIYFSNTKESGLFNEFPFHPDRLLKDYQIIFNRDTITPLRYFQRLTPCR